MTSAAEIAEAFYSDQPTRVDSRSVPVRFSNLKEMSKSPVHYLSALANQTASTLSMRLGTGTHAMLFEQPWIVYGGTNEKTGKKKVRSGGAWDEFQLAHADKVILSPGEYNDAKAMSDAIRAHPVAFKLLTAGVVEQTIKWRHELQGRACTGTPDVFTPFRVVELKTARTSEPVRFVRQGLSLSYHAQLAWYQDGVRLSGLGTPTEAYIVAVESSRPHPVTVLRLTDNALDQGRRLCRIWMERLLVSEAFDKWPPYVECEVPFDVEMNGELTLRIEGEEVDFD